MNITKEELKQLKEIIKKAKYNRLIGKLTISIDDYLLLRLSENSLKTLETLCEEKNIELERLPKPLTPAETKNLFIEYHKIKERLDNNPDDIEKEKLQERQIEIKQAIVLGHMEPIYLMLYKTAKELSDDIEIDDIYQIAYETTMEHIDSYKPSGGSFGKYLHYIIKYTIIERIWMTKRNISIHDARELIKLNNARNILISNGKEITIERLMEETGFSKNRINFLYQIGGYNDISIQKINNLSQESDIETELFSSMNKEYILALLDTLSLVHKQVILLSYGFINGKEHTNDEIAKILGYNTSERVRQIKKEALSILMHPIYSSNLNNPNEDITILNEHFPNIEKAKIEKIAEVLEDTAINSISPSMLKELIKPLPQVYQDVLDLYYGLKDGIQYSYKEISQILKKKEEVIRKRKRIGIERIAMNMNQNKPYLKTLTKVYLNNKTRKR